MTETKFPTEVIDLPSKGYFYPKDSPLAAGKLELKYLTAREEDILASRNLIQKGLVIQKLLESLIVTPGVKYEDLLLGDISAVFVASRILGYGKDYTVSMTCPNCGDKQTITVDLTKLEEKKVPEPKEKGVNLFKFQLPISKKTLSFRLLTQRDNKAISDEVEGYHKIDKNIDREVTSRLKRIITEIDGDATKVASFVENEFLARDARSFRDYYASVNPDIDSTFEFSCSSCGEHRRVEMPMGIGFFWPSAGESD